MRIVTLKTLAEFLLTLPDEEEINMATDSKDGCGCLMTKYGIANGFDFETSDMLFGWRDNNNYLQVAIEDNVFNIFKEEPLGVYCGTVGAWKKLIKPEFLNQIK